MNTVFKTRLCEERAVLRQWLPMVTPMNDLPSVYEGYCRCEKGPVKELADRGVWPFTEYVEMHKFRLELPDEYPLKHPIVTWLTDISHPNIVPFLRGVVCVSLLGEDWTPRLRLPCVIHALSHLLADPSPRHIWDHSKSLKAAEVVRHYGFPKMRTQAGKSAVPSDIVRFSIIDLPKPTSSDVVRFSIPTPKAKGEKQRGQEPALLLFD